MTATIDDKIKFMKWLLQQKNATTIMSIKDMCKELEMEEDVLKDCIKYVNEINKIQ